MLYKHIILEGPHCGFRHLKPGGVLTRHVDHAVERMRQSASCLGDPGISSTRTPCDRGFLRFGPLAVWAPPEIEVAAALSGDDRHVN